MTATPHMRIGVLRGGVSPEYEVSLRTGASVLKHIPSYVHAHDLLITRDGTWHLDGIPAKFSDIARYVDVVWNALHGAYGEDGKVQRELDRYGIPYTGSGVLSSALALHKGRAREHVSTDESPVRVPRAEVILDGGDISERALRLFREFPQPSVVKPLFGGSSIGVTLAESYDELVKGIERALLYGSAVIVEEFISGREAMCGIVEGFRGENIYALPPVEIRVPKTKGIFDYELKYVRPADKICPGAFTKEEKEMLMNAARFVHDALGLRHYSASDFIVNKRGIHFLEVNSLPGLTETSLLPVSLGAVGAPLGEFIIHVARKALAGT